MVSTVALQEKWSGLTLLVGQGLSVEFACSPCGCLNFHPQSRDISDSEMVVVVDPMNIKHSGSQHEVLYECV